MWQHQRTHRPAGHPTGLRAERLRHPALNSIVDDIARSTDDPVLIGLLAVERFTGMQIAETVSPSPVLVHRIPD
jgi:hypothetical protein